MAYNRENYIKIKREYETKRLAARDEAEKRLEQLHAKYPELRQIDAALAETGMRVFGEMTAGRDGLQDRLEKIKLENAELRAARRELFIYYGYPEDYTDIKYECTHCHDTGGIGTEMCVCMKKALVYAGYESSGIGNLIKTQSFETFKTSFYSDDPKALANIEHVLAACKQYADDFRASERSNLLLRGDTGLGKTHLSTSMAKVIIESGCDVVYDTAQNIFSDFEFERFGRGYNGGATDSRTDRYFDCDLLIIDDLGTEMSNQFTISCLYNIINTRINNERSCVINTNLGWDELRKRYADRITSRLFGEFRPLELFGKDIRLRKLK